MKKVMEYEAIYKLAVDKFLKNNDDWELARHDYPEVGDILLYLSPHGLILQECYRPQDYKCLRYILNRKIKVQKGDPVELVNRNGGARTIAYFVDEGEAEYVVTKGMVDGEPYSDMYYSKAFFTLEPLSS